MQDNEITFENRAIKILVFAMRSPEAAKALVDAVRTVPSFVGMVAVENNTDVVVTFDTLRPSLAYRERMQNAVANAARKIAPSVKPVRRVPNTSASYASLGF